jgi:hypothetical protein
MPHKGQGGSKGQQPEAVRSLKAAARAGSKKPDDQELQSTGRTAPRSAPLKAKQDTAAEVLKAGAEGRVGDMESAAKKAPKH